MDKLELFYEDTATVDVPCDEHMEVCWESVIREKNRIKDVHVLGFESKNKKRGKSYQYSKEAVQEAAPLYEGIDVYVNHTDADTKPRDIRDKIGFIENVYYKEEVGLKGDLVLNEKHDFYEQFIWWADNRPSQIGLSHHAGGVFNRSKGLCESIRVVRSVDIVTRPATTKGLFECVQEGVIEDSITEDKVKERFYSILNKAQGLLSERIYEIDSIQTRAAAVRRIAEDLASLMQDFTSSMSQTNPDNINESQEEDMKWEDITLEALLEHREDLASAIREDERVVLKAREQKLQESLKDVPEKLITDVFKEQCLEALDDDDKLKKLIEDRKSLAVISKPKSTPPTVTTVKENTQEEDDVDWDKALRKYKKGVK